MYALNATLVVSKKLGDLGGSPEGVDEFVVFHPPIKHDVYGCVNAPFINDLFTSGTIEGVDTDDDWHPSMQRLLSAARIALNSPDMKMGELRVALEATPQQMNAWQKRGLSKGAAFKFERLFGAQASWLLLGDERIEVEVPPKRRKLLGAPADLTRPRRIYNVGRVQGGYPARIWDDGGQPAGVTDRYAVMFSTDPQAFLSEVVGDSMSPRYQPGEYALVEPSKVPDLGEDALVRLNGGETMLKRLLSQRGGFVRLGSYNTTEVLTFPTSEVTWIYYVPHMVPARMVLNSLSDDPRDAAESAYGDL